MKFPLHLETLQSATALLCAVTVFILAALDAPADVGTARGEIAASATMEGGSRVAPAPR